MNSDLQLFVCIHYRRKNGVSVSKLCWNGHILKKIPIPFFFLFTSKITLTNFCEQILTLNIQIMYNSFCYSAYRFVYSTFLTSNQENLSNDFFIIRRVMTIPIRTLCIRSIHWNWYFTILYIAIYIYII